MSKIARRRRRRRNPDMTQAVAVASVAVAGAIAGGIYKGRKRSSVAEGFKAAAVVGVGLAAVGTIIVMAPEIVRS